MSHWARKREEKIDNSMEKSVNICPSWLTNFIRRQRRRWRPRRRPRRQRRLRKILKWFGLKFFFSFNLPWLGCPVRTSSQVVCDQNIASSLQFLSHLIWNNIVPARKRGRERERWRNELNWPESRHKKSRLFVNYSLKSRLYPRDDRLMFTFHYYLLCNRRHDIVHNNNCAR